MSEIHPDRLMCQAESRDECNDDAHWVTVTKDDYCTHCGQYRPDGCLCQIPVPKRYTQAEVDALVNEAAAEAWMFGRDQGIIDSMRTHCSETDSGARLWWIIRVVQTEPSPYEEDA